MSLLFLLSGCIGGAKSPDSGATPPPTVLNVMAVSVDGGPSAAPGAVNHAYVTVRICSPGSTTQCASVDHVLLDTGSWGLRVVRSVLAAAPVTLNPETDSQGQTIEECATLGSGQTWGPVATADVTLAGEVAAKLPVQVLDDTQTGAPPPAACGANGLVNGVADLSANGLLGVGVFAQDCGDACVGATPPLAVYYGCTAAGSCTPENVALAAQVTNPATQFAIDNNGIIVDLPNLQNANGDGSLQGELIFGLATQSDNALPLVGLTVLGTDSHGDFIATYNGGSALLPAMIDSGTDSYQFDDPSMGVCTSAAWVGYYCPAVAPQSVFAVNTGATSTQAVGSGGSSMVDFAVADPNTFVANAAAVAGLASGGGSTNFIWGMPFFYGRKVYIGFESRSSGAYTGPYFAY